MDSVLDPHTAGDNTPFPGMDRSDYGHNQAAP